MIIRKSGIDVCLSWLPPGKNRWDGALAKGGESSLQGRKLGRALLKYGPDSLRLLRICPIPFLISLTMNVRSCLLSCTFLPPLHSLPEV